MKKIVFFILFCITIYANSSTSVSDEKELINPSGDILTFGEEGIRGIFEPNDDIKMGNKIAMIIFGQNGCYYCKILLGNIKNGVELRDFLTSNFASYYINISHKKRHVVEYLKLEGITSRDFARIYNVSATPTIAFVDPNGELIMRVSGYPGEDRFALILKYVETNEWKNYTNERQRVRAFLKYENKESK